MFSRTFLVSFAPLGILGDPGKTGRDGVHFSVLRFGVVKILVWLACVMVSYVTSDSCLIKTTKTYGQWCYISLIVLTELNCG